MIRGIHIPDTLSAPQQLDDSWIAAAQEHLSAVEKVLAWLADPTHPVQRLLVAWREMELTVPYVALLAWMCEPRVYRRLVIGGPEIDAIIREWRQHDFGVYP